MNKWAYLILAAAFHLFSSAGVLARTPECITAVFGKNRVDYDIVYFTNNDVLRGDVLNHSLDITTPYGKLTVPLRQCAGISFEGIRANKELIQTVNFNRITGLISEKRIDFRIGSSGELIHSRKEKIRHIVLKRAAGELNFIRHKNNSDLFIMANGDLLTGTVPADIIRIATDYAQIPVRFRETAHITMQGPDNSSVILTKKNGDIMTGMMKTEAIPVILDIGVRLDDIYRDKFQRIITGGGIQKAAEKFGVIQPVQIEFKETDPGTTPDETFKNALGMEFRLIRPGFFMMGSPESENGRGNGEHRHKVLISQKYYIQTTEVTQKQWQAVMGSNPSYFKGENLPVENITWFEAQEFIKKLNLMGGDIKYRLPTEAEWEYACRAGSPHRFSFGNSVSELGRYAWYEENSGGRTHPVAALRPNPWGLYDMHGNVWEWCLDRGAWKKGVVTDTYVDNVKNPVSTQGTDRINRGGSWSFHARFCRSAYRYCNAPGSRLNSIGFRLAGQF